MPYQFFLKRDTNNSFKNKISFSLVYYSLLCILCMNCESRKQSCHNIGCVISTNSFFTVLVKLLSKGLSLIEEVIILCYICSYECELRIQIRLPLNSTSVLLNNCEILCNYLTSIFFASVKMGIMTVPSLLNFREV